MKKIVILPLIFAIILGCLPHKNSEKTGNSAKLTKTDNSATLTREGAGKNDQNLAAPALLGDDASSKESGTGGQGQNPISRPSGKDNRDISSGGGVANDSRPSPKEVREGVKHDIKVDSFDAAAGEKLEVNVSSALAGTLVILRAKLKPGRQVSLKSSGLELVSSVIGRDGETIEFTMPDQEVHISGVFSNKIYDIRIGNIGAAAGEGLRADRRSAPAGARITLKAGLNPGRKVRLKSPDLELTSSEISYNGGTITFIMPAGAVNISGVFSNIIYSIKVNKTNAAAGEGLRVSADSAVAGAKISLKAALNPGRQVHLKSGDLKQAFPVIDQNEGELAFTMPAGSVTIDGIFSNIIYDIQVKGGDAGPGESVKPSVSSAPTGTKVSLSASLGRGRQVVLKAKGLKEPLSTLMADGQDTAFIMPPENVSIIAIFSTIQRLTADGMKMNFHYSPGGTCPVGPSDGGVKTISAFWMGETEVSYALWSRVYTWAIGHGYIFANPGRQGGGEGSGFAGNPRHPVTTINWRDAVVWCNAATEWYNANNGDAEDLSCVYTHRGKVLKKSAGRSGARCDSLVPDATATGFRLPGEWEWEFAGRYQGSAGNGNSIGNSLFYTRGDSACGATGSYKNLDVTKMVAWSMENSGGSTHPVGEKGGNNLGLYDMSGNVWEWCFDLYGQDEGRVVRGGSWNFDASYLQLGYRSYYSPAEGLANLGFRLCRSAH